MPAELPRAESDVDVGDGLTLHVASSGAGRPLVLLHGFTGSGRSWDDLRRRLEPARQVITIDLPGHGASAAPRDPARYALPRLANDLVRVLDALQLDRAAVHGYSLGGRAALRLALAHPDRVSTLVLESCSPGISDPAERAARARDDAALADSIERDGVQAFVDRWERLPLWSSQAALPDAARARQRGVRLAGTATGLAASLRGAGVAAEPDAMGALHRLEVPTLVVAGALDTKYALIAADMAARLPQARLAVVDAAGHAVHLECPAQLASLVGQFLDNFDR
jgi:2-succinyl-6-hydroxy-2,4-cyclohexadiene-1-carboxylate synthase